MMQLLFTVHCIFSFLFVRINHYLKKIVIYCITSRDICKRIVPL
jgi:hypothetical protein